MGQPAGQADGQPLAEPDRRGNPGGLLRGADLRSRARLRPGRRPPGRLGSPSGGPQKAPPMPSWRGLSVSASIVGKAAFKQGERHEEDHAMTRDDPRLSSSLPGA